MTDERAKNLKPKLRFPDFRPGPSWVNRDGLSLFEEVSERATSPDLPVLAASRELGVIPREQIGRHISVSEHTVASYKNVRKGDFLVGLEAYRDGFDYSRLCGICSGDYLVLRRREKEGFDSFFSHLLKSERFIRSIYRISEGLRKRVLYRNFSTLLLPVPEPDEQRVIAECLDSLDEIIATERRSLMALRAHHKGLAQQLFPQEPGAMPRLRFPQFARAPDWPELNLGELVEMKLGKNKKSYALLESGDFPFLMVGDLKGSSRLEVRTRLFCNEGNDAVPKGALLFPRSGASIKSNTVRIAASKVIIGADVMALIPGKLISSDFLFNYISFVGLEKFSDEAIIPHIYKDQIRKFRISVPSLLEQRKISATLCSIGDMLEAQTRHLNALQRHKRGLFQRLFPDWGLNTRSNRRCSKTRRRQKNGSERDQ